jgi:DNA-damage-inducible protein J
VAREKSMPPELLIPNATTIAAMEEARARKDLPRAHSIEELMKELNSDD